MRDHVLHWLILLTLVSITSACEQECCADSESISGNATSLQGQWLLVERGYSPGAGYNVDQVPAFPAKTLRLNLNGGVITNIDELKAYSFYQIVDNPNSDEVIIGFFITRPTGPVELEELEHSYTIRWNEEKLELWFRYCFEGCHLGFVKK